MTTPMILTARQRDTLRLGYFVCISAEPEECPIDYHIQLQDSLGKPIMFTKDPVYQNLEDLTTSDGTIQAFHETSIHTLTLAEQIVVATTH